MTPTPEIACGECREVMAGMPEQHFHCCITSPPYFGLRSYPAPGHIGLEASPAEFVEAMRSVFGGRENPVGVWRILRDDATLFVNLGDGYAHSGACGGASPDGPRRARATDREAQEKMGLRVPDGLKPKDLLGSPWLVAFALQADGWYLRDAVVWAKPAPMPGSQRDRCTSSYEFIFQLSKRPRYFFDIEGGKERHADGTTDARDSGLPRERNVGGRADGYTTPNGKRPDGGKTPRNVWRIASLGFAWEMCRGCRRVYSGREFKKLRPKGKPVCDCGASDWLSHFATFPRALPEKIIRMATSEKGCCPTCGRQWERVVEKGKLVDDEAGPCGNAATDALVGRWNTGDTRWAPNRRYERTTTGWRPTCTCCDCGGLGCPACDWEQTVPARVLDPFGGAGTTALAAALLGRHGTCIEMSDEYCHLARERIARVLRPGTHVPTAGAEVLPLWGKGAQT